MTEKIPNYMADIHDRILTNETTSQDLVILYECAISGDFIPECIEYEFTPRIKVEEPTTYIEKYNKWAKILDKVGISPKLSNRSNTADLIPTNKTRESKSSSSSLIVHKIKWLK